jgi:peptide/nickel transport system permease protein
MRKSTTGPAGIAAKRAESYGRKQPDLSYASQYRLMRYRFAKHKLAIMSLGVLGLLYTTAILADFFAPYEKNHRVSGAQFSAPTRVHIYEAGRGFTRPFVYGMKKVLDEKTFTYQTVPDTSKKHTIRFFTQGHPYRLMGIVPSSLRLFGVEEGYVALFGTDQLGMDIFSQTLYAGRISLSVGLVGVAISFVLGLILGGVSGYFGGRIDDIIQRTIEFVMSLPSLPLWIALSAAIPNNWTGIKTYFAITIILSVIGWTGLARVVRGRLIAMREEDYVMAAKVAGSTDAAVIARHLLPGFMSYLVVSITLAIPHMILGETTLSFLGLGILPPEVSWGSLMQAAKGLTVIFAYPWHLIPTIFIVTAVLAFNFIGDGLRDAADPYSR